MNQTNGLFWFRHDLRVSDNEPLNIIAREVSSLLCVFIVDPRWFKPAHYQSAHMGQHRWRFLLDTLSDLDEQLKLRGQRLKICYGEPLEILRDLMNEHQISHMACNYHSGLYERQQGQRMQSEFPVIKAISGESHSLFLNNQLPFSLAELPATFSPFRRKVEKIE